MLCEASFGYLYERILIKSKHEISNDYQISTKLKKINSIKINSKEI